VALRLRAGLVAYASSPEGALSAPSAPTPSPAAPSAPTPSPATPHPSSVDELDSRPVGFESSVTPPLGPGGEVFYDDNAWIALTLLEHHRRQGDAASLALARRVVAFCCTGWSTEPGWSCPGGIRWKVPPSNRSRNACANAPVAEASALLFLRTGDIEALRWARRIYDWVRTALLGPDDLYLDRIMPEGTRAPERWTYNQGTMIGAGVLLAEATGEPRYLGEARATAEAVLARFDVETLLRRNGPAFNAILIRNLFLLDRQVPDPRLMALARSYGEATWERHPARRIGALGPVGPRTLNATAPLIELYALLAGATPHP
jgi:Glycosyl hydrolase family 76